MCLLIHAGNKVSRVWVGGSSRFFATNSYHKACSQILVWHGNVLLLYFSSSHKPFQRINYCCHAHKMTIACICCHLQVIVKIMTRFVTQKIWKVTIYLSLTSCDKKCDCVSWDNFFMWPDSSLYHMKIVACIMCIETNAFAISNLTQTIAPVWKPRVG